MINAGAKRAAKKIEARIEAHRLKAEVVAQDDAAAVEENPAAAIEAALPKRRGRPPGSKSGRRVGTVDAPEAMIGTNVVQRVVDPPYVFEQSYKRCGPGCSVCVRGGEHFNPRRPGHGPYWYRLFRKDGKTFRKYLGLKLKKTTEVHNDGE